MKTILRGEMSVKSPQYSVCLRNHLVLRDKVNDIIRSYGVDEANEIFLIAVHVESQDCQDWLFQHYHDYTGYIPYSLIKDTKEGEVLSINWGEHLIQLKAVQANYKYSEHTKFEEALKDIVEPQVVEPQIVETPKKSLWETIKSFLFL